MGFTDKQKEMLLRDARIRLITKMLQLDNSGKNLGVIQEMEAIINKVPMTEVRMSELR